MKRVLLVFIFFITLEAEPYTLGNGLQINDLPIFIGGYTSLEYEYQPTDKSFTVDDIAFLSYGGMNGISYLVELEFKKLYDRQWGTNELQSFNTTLYKERLYLQYDFDDSNSLRIGKYNNAIGFWNLTPINILRETTSNPGLTSIIYPKFVTGLMYSYSDYSDLGLKIDALVQYNDNLDAPYNNYQINEHSAIGVTLEDETSAYKMNVGYFKESNYNYYYALLGYKYDYDVWQIMGEVASQYYYNAFSTKYALYLQSLYRVDERHSLILRVESYDSKKYSSTQNLAIFGYTYRPLPPIALKGEFQFNQDSLKNKLLFSFSVLF